jgi:hypothetical protein
MPSKGKTEKKLSESQSKPPDIFRHASNSTSLRKEKAVSTPKKKKNKTAPKPKVEHMTVSGVPAE